MDLCDKTDNVADRLANTMLVLKFVEESVTLVEILRTSGDSAPLFTDKGLSGLQIIIRVCLETLKKVPVR